MEQSALKYKNLLGAWNAYTRSVELYYHQQQKPENQTDGVFSSEEMVESARRSLIQAFEILIEVLWKYLKWLMEEVYQAYIPVTGPRPIVTQACELRIISELDAQSLLNLLTLRNQTSHIYKEELIILITQKLCAAQDQLATIIVKLKA